MHVFIPRFDHSRQSPHPQFAVGEVPNPSIIPAAIAAAMEIELRDTAPEGSPEELAESSENSTYRVSAQPVISYGRTPVGAEALDLPRSYGTQSLTLMARDPRSIFAYWDIDWSAAFRGAEPEGRKVHLRLLNADGSEETTLEIEPMAGSCYITVPNANTTYGGEIGFFQPPEVWNSLATSELITTPSDTVAGEGEADFATVPFHLTFQHMIDLLRISKQENESLTAMLSDLRERAKAPENEERLNDGQRDLAQILESADSGSRASGQSMAWTQQRLERVLGFGNSSSAGGFGGSSKTR